MKKELYFYIANLNDFQNSNKITKKVNDDLELLLIKIGDAIFCVENRCSHDEKPLNDGTLEEQNKQIQCKYHGAVFSLETGKALKMPAVSPINIYKLKVEDGKIYVLLE